MKRSIFLIILLAGIATVSGILMSKASWLGRVGMTFFHKEYNLLKVWWEGALAVFVIFMALFIIHTIIHQTTRVVLGRVIHFVLFLAALGCAYLTYDDFTNDFTHRLLKWRFHYGFYLIWVGWVLISLFFLFKKKKVKLGTIDPGKTETTDPQTP
jgi:hypothetical protein